MATINKVCVGESLIGDGNEVAHIDLIMGPRGSAAESAFCNALANNKDGFTSLLAVVAPNLLTKPNTVMFNKVTIKGAKQAVQMFGPAQHAVAKAVADSVAEGVIPAERGRRPVHLRRRVHPLGGGRRQEDPRLQLPRHEGGDFPCGEGRAPRRRRRQSAQHRQASFRRQLNGKNGGPYGPPFQFIDVMSVNGTASVPNCKFTPLVPDVTPVMVPLTVNGTAAVPLFVPIAVTDTL